MRRWPFILVAIVFMLMNVARQTGLNVTVWNDAICNELFMGYLICIAVATSIRDKT